MSAAFSPDCPLGALDATAPSILTARMGRFAGTPAPGSTPLRGHVPAPGGVGETDGWACVEEPAAGAGLRPPPHPVAMTARTSSTTSRGDRIVGRRIVAATAGLPPVRSL